MGEGKKAPHRVGFDRSVKLELIAALELTRQHWCKLRTDIDEEGELAGVRCEEERKRNASPIATVDSRECLGRVHRAAIVDQRGCQTCEHGANIANSRSRQGRMSRLGLRSRVNGPVLV